MTKRTGGVWPYNEHNEDAMPGDIMVDLNGAVWKLDHSRGWGKRMLGELTPTQIKRPGKRGKIIEGQLVWVDGEIGPVEPGSDLYPFPKPTTSRKPAG
ncbi:MAG: hypothetical protein WC683_04410 [bacterium]